MMSGCGLKRRSEEGRSSMTLQERIRQDYARRGISRKEREALRVVLGELQRQRSKELDDTEVVKILKKLLGYEREMSPERRDEEYIGILEAYLPDEASEEEIVQWIRSNIDFGRYRNKMQAIREVLAHFGPRTEGETVREVLQKRF
jgi:hypothetical protein